MRSFSDDYTLYTQVTKARDNLRKHQRVKIRGARVRSRAHWLQNGDRCSNFFFNLLKQKQANESIDRILVDDKEIIDIDGIKWAFVKLYTNLFTSEDSEEAKVLRYDYKRLIPNRISW